MSPSYSETFRVVGLIMMKANGKGMRVFFVLQVFGPKLCWFLKSVLHPLSLLVCFLECCGMPFFSLILCGNDRFLL